MHTIRAKIRRINCPLTACNGLCEPTGQEGQWECRECKRTWFLKLVGSE